MPIFTLLEVKTIDLYTVWARNFKLLWNSRYDLWVKNTQRIQN